MRNVRYFMVLNIVVAIDAAMLSLFSLLAEAYLLATLTGLIICVSGFTAWWLHNEHHQQRRRYMGGKPTHGTTLQTLSETLNVVEAAQAAGRCSPDLGRRMMDLYDRFAHHQVDSPLRAVDTSTSQLPQ